MGFIRQTRTYVSDQRWLVVLGEKNVVAPLGHDLGTDVALAEHGVAAEEVAADRQNPQQLQGGLVLVGLGVHADLGEDGLDVRRVGGDEVLTGRIAVMAAAGGLAVEGDVEFFVGWQAGGDPARQGGFKGDDVELTKQDGKGGWGGCFAAAKSQDVGEGKPFIAAELGDGGVGFTPGEHGENGEGQNGGERMALATSFARVGNVRKSFDQGKRGRHRMSLRAMR